MKKSKFYRDTYNGIKEAISDYLTEVLNKAEYAVIELDDVRGSLIYNTIDDQQSEVISSIYLKYDTTSPTKSRITIEVSDGIEGYEVKFEELNIELMLNVVDAVEKAIEE
jgi:hypothetical protein